VFCCFDYHQSPRAGDRNRRGANLRHVLRLVISTHGQTLSKLPPERTNTICRPASSGKRPLNSAASPAAPAPSITHFSNSANLSIAKANHSSSIETILCFNCLVMESVRSPACATANPSARVNFVETRTASPAATPAAKHEAFFGSTPMISRLGLSACSTMAVPDSRPPPPTGTRIASQSGTCSRISNPYVPCPGGLDASKFFVLCPH